ncbi:Spo7-like protein-domain-containing protein [Halenospora varia]|nr:Spo7-like protein-domain-containing protein [Halenospora varia]
MSSLDQLVKGAPPPGSNFSVPSTTPIISPETSNVSSLPDPLASLPSSPPQIYLNLLILEASLRAQWLQLRTRRRQYTFFLTLLGIWTFYFAYALFLKPREDGRGLGGSVYWAVELGEKLSLVGGLVTWCLIWFTGMWERGVRWPRRWVLTTNRGLRGFNCKLVVIKQSLWKEFLSWISFFFSGGLLSGSSGSSYRYVDHKLLRESEKATRNGGHHALPNIHEDDEEGHEEDLAPGGDHIKLLLLPKPFSPNFRENWDVYRSEYWEKENERRAILRKKVQERDRKLAKEQGGWLWWIGYRGFDRGKTHDPEKTHHVHRHGTVEKRTRSGSVRSGSHSRNSSRSSMPTVELEDGPTAGHVRRGSNASTSSERRRKKVAPGNRVQKLTPSGSRSATPEVPSPLVRESSFTSVSSTESERLEKAAEGESAKPSKGSRPAGPPLRRTSSVRAAKQT